jgi:hypothetical protein
MDYCFKMRIKNMRTNIPATEIVMCIMKYYLIIMITLLGNATFTWAETPSEAIATLSTDAQQWVNQSCPRSLGPSIWSSCVMREVAALRSGIPDMSNLNAENQSWISASCPSSLGPSVYRSCVRREIAAIEAGMPALSDLSKEQRAWLQQSCPSSLGPSVYRSCVRRERAALTNSNQPSSAPPARVSPTPTPSAGGSSRRGYPIEVAHNDELFIINGEKYEAKTYCLGWDEGEEVMFLEGSAFGACASAKLLNLNRKKVCEVWCE